MFTGVHVVMHKLFRFQWVSYVCTSIMLVVFLVIDFMSHVRHVYSLKYLNLQGRIQHFKKGVVQNIKILSQKIVPPTTPLIDPPIICDVVSWHIFIMNLGFRLPQLLCRVTALCHARFCLRVFQSKVHLNYDP